MHMRQILITALLGGLLALAGCSQHESSAGADHVHASPQTVAKAADAPYVYIVSPVDGAVLPSTFKVVFGLDGMGIAPAGTDAANTGHHHLLINLDELPPMDRPLPTTDQVRHFGGGQTETTVTLEPGTHTLQLLLGNFAHIPHEKPLLSSKITITVKAN